MHDLHAQPPSLDPLIGQTLGGRYLVQELLDRGGMGKVFRAEQQPLGRQVALKTLDLHDPTGEFQQRFFTEASVASKLSHPNTVRVFDYGRSDNGVYFLTMELLKGHSLHKVLKTEGRIDPARMIAIVRQVCGAMHEAHEAGIVHRDLKPGNIFLTQHDEDLEFAKVLDFGLVKDLESQDQLSRTGQTLGSPLYMSPEQIEGQDLDRRADIYSLGLVLYVALTGKVPFKRGNVATIMFQQVAAKIPPFHVVAPDLQVSEGLEWVVRRCIEKAPENRFANMRELSLALKIVLREMRGESAPIEWLLQDGLLVLPDDLMFRDVTEMPSVEPLAGAPSMPTMPVMDASMAGADLERSNVSLAVGATAVGVGGIGVIVMVALLVVLLLAGIIALAIQNRPTPVVTAPAPVVDVVPEPAPEPAAPASVQVMVTSKPAGAELSVGGVVVGPTPQNVQVGVAEGDAPLKATLTRTGFVPADVVLDGSQPSVLVELKKKRVAPQPSTPRPTPTPSPSPKPKPIPDKVDDGVRDPWAN